MRHIIKFFATGCYAGFIPAAPGTFGTLVGVGLFLLIRNLPAPAYAAFCVAFIALSVWISNHAQDIFTEIDPQRVVIDEIAGFLVTIAFHDTKWPIIVTGFILFRIFDIAKPWPAGWVEKKFTDGRGIVFDDVIAGVYANATLWFAAFILTRAGVN